MYPLFMPPTVTQVVVYLEPIDVRLGPDRLRAFCREVIGIEPDESTGFMFTNRARDALLLYYVGAGGDGVLRKKLDKGAFLMPVPTPDGKKWTKMEAAMVGRLLRS